MKISHKLCFRMDVTQFFGDDLQPKMSAGMMKEHECIFVFKIMKKELMNENLIESLTGFYVLVLK